MCDCLRLASDGPGLAVYPKHVQPCAQFPEVCLGTPGELAAIVANDRQGAFNRLRKETLQGIDEDVIWSCPECRPAICAALQRLQADGSLDRTMEGMIKI